MTGGPSPAAGLRLTLLPHAMNAANAPSVAAARVTILIFCRIPRLLEQRLNCERRSISRASRVPARSLATHQVFRRPRRSAATNFESGYVGRTSADHLVVIG
jgi:hypothetical protein